MALSANDVIKVVVSMAFPDSVIAQNVFWTLFDAGGTSEDEDDVLDDLDTWMTALYNLWKAEAVDNCTATELKAYVYDSVEDDFDEVGVRALGITGLDVSHYLPQGIAAVLHANTVNPDVIGGKYWGGYGEDQNDDGVLTVPLQGDIALMLLEWVVPFIGPATGATFTPGVWSETKTNFFEFNGNGTLNTTWGYQRRRKPGVGI